ncbi:MAG: hypothetical protein JSU98_01020 [Gemmatimonadales bacterium]|nr:MAG: hypothetical protein JSU98_01020 [Gemmatimonadales bacterium]
MDDQPKPPAEGPPEGPGLSSREEREALLGEILAQADAPAKPSPDAPSLSSEQEREAMLAEVARDSEAREVGRRPTGPRRATTPLRLAVALLSTAVAGWLWLFPPAFLGPPPGGEMSTARIEAGLRMAVALQAERIFAHRDQVRRLPDFLREVGDSLPGILYRRLDGGTFLLLGRAGDVEVEYRSDQPLAEFIAPALRTLETPP